MSLVLIIVFVVVPLVIFLLGALKPSLVVRAAVFWIRRSISQLGLEGEVQETELAEKRARLWSGLFLIYWILLLVVAAAGILGDPELLEWIMDGNI